MIDLLAKKDVEKLRASAAASNSKLFAKESNEWTEEVVDGVNAVFTGSTWDRCRMLTMALTAFDPFDVVLIFSEEINEEDDDQGDVSV